MPLTQEERDEIFAIAAQGTKTDLADEIAKRTVLSSDEVRKLMTGIDKDVLARTVAEVMHATKTNNQKAQAVTNIAGGVEVLVKIATLLL
jgi:hypothetical protein